MPDKSLFLALIMLVIMLGKWRGCNAFMQTFVSPCRVIVNSADRRSVNGASIKLYTKEGDRAPFVGDKEKGDEEIERLRESALKLREEAKALEASMTTRPNNKTDSTRGAAPTTPLYFEVENSSWELTYRFSDEPPPSESPLSDSGSSSLTGPPLSESRKFFSGKVRIKFRSDGYTDTLSQQGTLSSTTGAASNNDVSFRKFWGWDQETSSDDGNDYILFSADVIVPSPSSTTERFYFQARVGKDDASGKLAGKTGECISLKDGSVTVKRDIQAPGGFWGIFRGADGILAQFRQVGEFKCRAIREDD